MRNVYLAGPMSGRFEFNREAFDAAAEHLRRGHFAVINPHDIDRARGYDWTGNDGHTLPDDFDYRDTLRQCLGLIDACDMVVVLDGWEQSTGARIEVHYAQAVCGIPIRQIGPFGDLHRVFPRFEVQHEAVTPA